MTQSQNPSNLRRFALFGITAIALGLACYGVSIRRATLAIPAMIVAIEFVLSRIRAGRPEGESDRREGIWSGIGIASVFVVLPLTQMVLRDPQTLWLGSWDFRAYFLFILIAYISIPLLFALLLHGAFRISSRTGRVTALFLVSYFLLAAVRFFKLDPIPAAELKLVWRFLILSAVFGLPYAFGRIAYQFSFNLLKTVSVLCLLCALVFAYETYPPRVAARMGSLSSNAAPTKIAQPAAPVQSPKSDSDKPFPVFFLTFEKLVWEYFVDSHGNLLEKEFPNLASLARVSDNYTNLWANSVATVVALSTLYTGRAAFAPVDDSVDKPTLDLRNAIGRNREVYMVLDLLNYCDHARDHCVPTIGLENVSRLAIIEGWFKTFALTVLPTPILHALKWDGWEFKPWGEMWDQEVGQAFPMGHEIDNAVDVDVGVGKRQMDHLLRLVRANGDKPALYITHNFVSDSPSIKSSEYFGATPAEKQKDIHNARENLREFDKEVGRFIATLKEVGIFDRSLIILTGDTGYEAMARHFTRKESIKLGEELAHVYFLLKRPGQTEKREFKTVFRQVDVLPTLMALDGLDPADYKSQGKATLDPSIIETFAERPLWLDVGGFIYLADTPKRQLRLIE